MTQITISNLSIGYDGKSIADNINFEINQGDYICIIGDNGAGKSTLVKTIIGLNSPLSGKIDIAPHIKDKIAYLPQQTITQKDFPATVEEVVISGRQKHGLHKLFYNKEDKRAVSQALAQFNIGHLAKRSFQELSGGQKQRVLLARALCDEKEILFLDEPVSGLDPTVTDELYALLKDINQNGITVVMISHDMDGVNANASHILHIGKENYFREAQHE